jgi:hypothetical protein
MNCLDYAAFREDMIDGQHLSEMWILVDGSQLNTAASNTLNTEGQT